MDSEQRNQHILLAARPSGEIRPQDFSVVNVPMPSPGEGEILVESRYLAVEPAMKGWMEDRVDYVAALQIGDVMRGHGVGCVLESNNPDYPVGAMVMGQTGWRRYLTSDGRSIPLRLLPPGVAAPGTHEPV